MGLYGKFGAKVDIAAISAEMQPVVEDWFNAEIEIIDPHIQTGAFDRMANTKDRDEPDVLWAGPARIQAMRWPNVATARQEAISARTVVFHIPVSEDVPPHMIREGFRVHVVDGGMSPEFEDGLFVITTSVNSSYAWDRRIETTQDQGTIVGY
jgi:hypothetical protein